MNSHSQNTDTASKTPLPLLMVAFFLAIFSYQFNASMLSPALPSMSAQLGADSNTISTTQTVFFASSAAFSLFLPRLGDLIGRKRTTLGMLATASLGCVISATAPNILTLCLGRALQGVTGPIISLCLLMLRERVTDEKRYASLLAITLCANGGIAGLDALAGGWLANSFGFRSVFWTMAVTGTLGFITILLFATESLASNASPMDWPGISSLVIALSSLLLSISMLRNNEHNLAIVALLIVISACSFAEFTRIEQHSKAPLASIDYLKQRSTWGFLLTVFLALVGVFATMNGVIPAAAQHQQLLSMSAQTSTLVTLVPYAAVGMAVALIAGPIAGRLGYLTVFRLGLAVTALSLGFGIYAMQHLTIASLIALSVSLGIGYVGFTFIMINALAVALSPANAPGTLPGLNAGVFNIASSMSYLLLYSVQTGVETSYGIAYGYAASLGIGFIAVTCAFACSFIIRK